MILLVARSLPTTPSICRPRRLGRHSSWRPAPEIPEGGAGLDHGHHLPAQPGDVRLDDAGRDSARCLTMTAFVLGFISAVFDNIPRLVQGPLRWAQCWWIALLWRVDDLVWSLLLVLPSPTSLPEKVRCYVMAAQGLACDPCLYRRFSSSCSLSGAGIEAITGCTREPAINCPIFDQSIAGSLCSRLSLGCQPQTKNRTKKPAI